MALRVSGRIQRTALALLLALLVALAAAVILPGAAAAKPKPHVWLHYDYLVYPNHSDEPDPLAIQRVVDAYAAHGILLEIDEEHTAIPATDPVLALDTVGGGCSGLSFSALKEKYFKGHKGRKWHYVIFGDEVTTTAADCNPVSGVAELPGDDFIVGMSRLRHPIPTIERQATAGTFMHELGHNLGLRHGGDENLSFKPNYISVMNPLFQFGIRTLSTGFRIDYSDSALPTLDQMHLNEPGGVGADNDDLTRFFMSRCTGCNLFAGGGPARGPLDWNLDGDGTDTDVAANLFAPPGNPLPRFLTGFDDWTAVRGFLAGPAPATKRIVP